MDEDIQDAPVGIVTENKPKQEVYVLRDWKEYLGESALIVFSVLLALFLTEIITKRHETEQTNELLSNIKAELVKNKKAEEEQYLYQAGILKKIDSALTNLSLQQKLVTNSEFHFNALAPHGVLLHDLSRVAWQVAQSQNITSKIDFTLTEQLTDIYDNQARIEKLEDGIAHILLSYESRSNGNTHATLILLRDTYKGWAFDRAKDLINKYDAAIKAIKVE